MAEINEHTSYGSLTNAEAALYTAPGASRARIVACSLVNTANAARDVYLLLLGNGDTGGTHILKVSIPAGHTVYPRVPVFLEPGMMVLGYASVDGDIDYVISIESNLA